MSTDKIPTGYRCWKSLLHARGPSAILIFIAASKLHEYIRFGTGNANQFSSHHLKPTTGAAAPPEMSRVLCRDFSNQYNHAILFLLIFYFVFTIVCYIAGRIRLLFFSISKTMTNHPQRKHGRKLYKILPDLRKWTKHYLSCLSINELTCQLTAKLHGSHAYVCIDEPSSK